jgi:hypothetical protein
MHQNSDTPDSDAKVDIQFITAIGENVENTEFCATNKK